MVTMATVPAVGERRFCVEYGPHFMAGTLVRLAKIPTASAHTVQGTKVAHIAGSDDAFWAIKLEDGKWYPADIFVKIEVQ